MENKTNDKDESLELLRPVAIGQVMSMTMGQLRAFINVMPDGVMLNVSLGESEDE